MTADQPDHDYKLSWLHDLLRDECAEFERSNAALQQMLDLGVTVMDVLHVMRSAREVSSFYEGGCFVVCAKDLDNCWLSVVIAPPSAKNRVRVVKVWRGK